MAKKLDVLEVRGLMGLKVTLSVEGGGEGSVVEGPGDGPGPRVLGHPHDAVLGLVGGKLPPQLVHQDVRLSKTRVEG